MNRLSMSEAPVSRLYLSYLLPTVIAMVSNSLYCLADVYFISIGSGTLGLAAVNIVMPMYTLYSCIGLLFGVGASTIIAIERGAGHEQRADQAFSMSVAAVVISGSLLMVLSLLFIEPLARLLGSSEQLLPYVIEYLRPVAVFTPAFIAMYAAGILIRCDHAPRLVMGAMLTGNLSNIVLDYVFVIVFGWGLTGAAAATALSPMITLIITAFHFILKRNQLHFCRFAMDGALFRRMLSNGAGSGVLELSAGVIIFVFNAVILAVSDEVFLAAYAIIANIAYVLKGLFGAFGQAAQPIISHNYGAGDMRRVKQTLRIALISSLLFALALYALCLFFPTQLAAFFANHDRAVIALGAAGIVLYFSSLPFSALNTVIMYYFQSIEQGRCATLLALLKGTLFAFIGMALLYALFQENGIWLTITFAEGCALILAWIVQRRIDRS